MLNDRRDLDAQSDGKTGFKVRESTLDEKSGREKNREE